MKLSDKIKANITPNSTAGAFSASALMQMHGQEILAAVEAAEEGRVLPRLPGGWVYSSTQIKVIKKFDAVEDCFEYIHQGGITPAAAAQAAIDKTTKDKV